MLGGCLRCRRHLRHQAHQQINYLSALLGITTATVEYGKVLFKYEFPYSCDSVFYLAVNYGNQDQTAV